jgi:hypothetical protein
MDRPSIPKPDGQPIRRFARFFKAYNVGLSLVVAAVPILISVWDAVPLYANTKNYLALVTSVASYLLVGFIFSQRAAIGRLYFPAWTGAAYSRDFRVGRLFGKVPLLLLAVSVLSFYFYFPLLNRSIERIAYEYTFDKASSNTTICEAQSLSPGQRRVVPAEFVAFGVSASVTVYCASRAATTEGEPSHR